jgi:uncharacterized membrane protein YGL010W
MKSLVEQLAGYAAYHRDRWNIATHFAGIPLIVVGVEALLARPAVHLAGLPGALDVGLSPALVGSIAVSAFYVALDRRYGLAMAALLALALRAGVFCATQSLGVWLASAGALFFGGWALQFVGHALEGKKPAFVDDLVGLLVGPLFLVAEASFVLGFREEIRAAVERRVGPTHRHAGRRSATIDG